MTWTPVAKPTTRNYTNVNPLGKEQYDESSITYDMSTVYYDGVNMNAWTKVAKPTGGILISPGMATGLIMPPTYAIQRGADTWTRVPKPT